MDYQKIADTIPKNEIIRKEDLLKIVSALGVEISESSIYWLIRKLINADLIVRIGRNQYCLASDKRAKKKYDYRPSKRLEGIIELLENEYPLMEFQVWEAIQFNYFVNHQIAHNTLFIEVESMVEEFVYEFLREEYDGNVLLNPDEDVFGLYATENTIVIYNLITETPTNKTEPHLITLEKLIVDMMCSKIIPILVQKSEYRNVLEEAFSKYVIDEKRMFRYARRRNAELKLNQFMKENTHIRLNLEEYHVK